MPVHCSRTVRALLVAATALAPLAVLLGAMLNPAIGGTAQENLAANATASAGNTAHVWLFVVASFLLPGNALGLAVLALPRAPRLAVTGGVLGLVGWVPFAALAAQDDLTQRMATSPLRDQLSALWHDYTTDPVMTTFLVIYAAGHLVAYTLLGAGLLPGRPVPAWAAWAVIVTNPLQVVAFVVHSLTRWLVVLACAVLLAGCLPAARALARDRRPCTA